MTAPLRPVSLHRLGVVKLLSGLLVLGWAVAYLAGAVRGDELARVVAAVVRDPLGLALALAAYAAAFALRAWAWCRVLPGLPRGQSWAALHVSLLGNHVLPLRLGEVLRPVSVARRTSLGWDAATASTVTLRSLDLLAVLGLAALVAPALLRDTVGTPVLVGGLAVLAAVAAAGVGWGRRLRGAVRVPSAAVLAATVLAWGLEAAVVWQVARVAGLELTGWQAVGVTAVTIAAQAVAVTPGGFGTYEAAATAAMVGLGASPGTAFAVALTTHAVKTAYSLVLGGVAVVAPGPTLLGPLRLARQRPPRPRPVPVAPDAPVVVIIPVHDEEATVGEVVARVPREVAGRPVEVVVVDDGSADASAARASAAGATVVGQPDNLGLGAAVRRGLAEAVSRAPAAVVYLDADLEYFPDDIPAVAAPVLAGEADYVVGSRFTGDIRRMLAHRRLGNVVLTRWVRWMTREPRLTDGQSGFRAFSPAAAADGEIGHDYNYAQVLTLDLLGKGYAYAEVPITYAFRANGRSFVRLGRYLRRVVPAVLGELAGPQSAQSSTTWFANRARAAAQDASSLEPSGRSAVTAS